MDLPNRRPSITESAGPFAVTVSFHPDTGSAVECFITARGRSGTELDDHLYAIGIAASKIMQHEE